MQDIISLYRNYNKYDHLQDYDIQHYLKPSILLNQYKKHYYNNKLVGFTNWAYLSDYASNNFQITGTINYDEWNSGNNIWHVETICISNLKDIISWTKNYFAKRFGSNRIINWLRTDNKKIYRNTKRIIKDNWLWVE
jgi:hemolysin-activating ACP:hemolysin acyltransferase